MADTLKKPEYPWPVLWGAACLVLAGVLVLEHYFGHVGPESGPPASARVVEAKLLPPFALPPQRDAESEAVTRPLFMPGRRPAPPALAGDAAVLKKGQLVLQGTAIVGDLSYAMFKEAGSGKVHRVPKGGKVLEMTVTEVAPGHAVVSLGGESETIPLLVAKGSGAASTAAAAGPFTPSTPATAGSRQRAAPVRPASAAPGVQAGVPAPATPAGGPAVQAGGSAPAPAIAPGTVDPAAPQPTSRMSAEEILERRRAARRNQAPN